MSRRLFPALCLLGLLSLGLPARALAQHDAEPPHAAADADHGAHGAADGGNPDILEFKPSLAVATVIVFLLLLLVLWRFAWGPLAKALHDREHHHEEMLRQAEHARAESERLLAQHRAQMDQAAEQVRGLIDEARRDAQSTAQDIVTRAHAEAESSRQRAHRDIEQARDQALMEIWTKSADLALGVAGRVLAREMNDDERRRLVDVAMSELPPAPGGAAEGRIA